MLKNVLESNKYKFGNSHDKYHEEYQYLNLLSDILKEGTTEKGRNGITKCVYGAAMHFSLDNGKIPILTTKKISWKTCLKELLWFVNGKTDNKLLNEQNVHIWDGNSTKEYMKTRGLNYEEGDLGPIYGFQWRHFNASYEGCAADYKDKGIDQLQNVIDCLKDPKQRTSRRLIVSAWNPCQVDDGALPSCHNFFQFNVVSGNKLSCSMYQRSNDCILGVPFNIASYSFLTHLIAKHCGLEAYEFIHFMGNSHIYENAIDAAKLQIIREPYSFPNVSIKEVRENINDYQVEDFEINNYKSHDAIKVAMVA
jgi:thymidylate synthase